MTDSPREEPAMRSYFTKLFGSANVSKAQAVVKGLWGDDVGALIATEWVIVATIIVLGIIPGLIAVRQGTLSELTDAANALLSLNQSYSFSGQALVCGNCDRVEGFGDEGAGTNGTGGNVPGVGGINNLPAGAAGAKLPAGTGANATANGGAGALDGVGAAQTTGCRPMALTSGSAFQDTCKSVATRKTPATTCPNPSGPCD